MNQRRGYGHRRALLGRAALAVFLVGMAAACSRVEAAPQGTLVAVHEHDFALTADVTVVAKGLVTFRVHNTGPSSHEFIVARTEEAADALPLQKSSLQVDEDSKQIDEVGSLSDIRLGTTRDLTVNLRPGHYVLFCNLAGHYLGGMHAAIEVIG